MKENKFKIPFDRLAFFWGSVKKKESYSEYVVTMMPFNFDEIVDMDNEKKWDRLAELAVEYLRNTKKLPSFAKEQDYERTGSSSYVGAASIMNNIQEITSTPDVNKDFVMTVDEGVFSKIIIPNDFKQKIIEAITQLKEHKLIFEQWGFGEVITKGRGVNMLFSGVSGTGKTYCGEIIAEYIGVPVELVSVASIESKWVGESEKNISNIFKSLQGGNKVLVLDEVDSFLTSRSMVNDSSPHYNKLTNQFLVELERHNGICVMTTNRPVKLDKALQRRIDVVLDFPFPSVSARKEIWKYHIPSKAPVKGNLDFDALAVVELNGGQIKNAVMDAARKAALSSEKKITQEMLQLAATSEMAEASSILNGKDHS